MYLLCLTAFCKISERAATCNFHVDKPASPLVVQPARGFTPTSRPGFATEAYRYQGGKTEASHPTLAHSQFSPTASQCYVLLTSIHQFRALANQQCSLLMPSLHFHHLRCNEDNIKSIELWVCEQEEPIRPLTSEANRHSQHG